VTTEAAVERERPLVRKAVITAAGMGTRHFPATATIQKELFPLVDRDGTTKPTLQIIAEEALEAGIEQICIVTSPASLVQFQNHFRGLTEETAPFLRGKVWAMEEAARLEEISRHIEFVVQEKQEGYGHAVYCARDFVNGEPFLLLLGDHVYIPETKKTCSRQLIDVYMEYGCAVSGVQRTPEDLLHLFGTLTGRRCASGPDVYEVTAIKEKPTLEYAEEHLRTQGLGRGQYLCFFGMHIFPPAIFDCIEYHIRHDIRERGEIQLTNAQDLLRSRERYLAAEVSGERYDMGVPFGYIQTQLALAIHSGSRRDLLAALAQLLTVRDLGLIRSDD
jgi:UTP--glucose-1-phosphate uridylyltransferase